MPFPPAMQDPAHPAAEQALAPHAPTPPRGRTHRPCRSGGGAFPTLSAAVAYVEAMPVIGSTVRWAKANGSRAGRPVRGA